MGLLGYSVLTALLSYGFFIALKLDVGRVVYNRRPGVCRHVEGPVGGSEAIEVVPSKNIAFISNGLKFPTSPESLRGKIFLYDFAQSGANPKAVELPLMDAPFDQGNFHPHGLSHWIIDGIVRLYVINHDNNERSSIEVFDYDDRKRVLIYRKTMQNDEAMRSPNDLAAVGPDEVIFGNDRYGPGKGWTAFEFLTGFRGGSVFYTDGKKYEKLLDGKHFPNGAAYDAKTKTFVMAFLGEETVEAFRFDHSKKTSKLTLISTTNVHSKCDNVFITGTDVYVGCHPILVQAAKSLSSCGDLKSHVAGPSQIMDHSFCVDVHNLYEIDSSTIVLRLHYNADFSKADVSEEYSNGGSELSASSSAVVHNKQMLIGTVCERLIFCQL